MSKRSVGLSEDHYKSGNQTSRHSFSCGVCWRNGSWEEHRLALDLRSIMQITQSHGFSYTGYHGLEMKV
ncbi:hypothetical protein DTO280E4_5533 [Paecilomyces variotii]|nr:hypothetical protein DTO280E4_5533 [Paecilomyces variotii]